jgi:TolB protein
MSNTSFDRSRFGPSLLWLLLLCCTGDPPPTAIDLPARPPSLEIRDAAHGGIAHFYFLPPMVPQPEVRGDFDPALAPEVAICALAGTRCGDRVAAFSLRSTPPIVVDADAESYTVTWNTRDAGLDPAVDYRLRVRVGQRELGMADIDVVATRDELSGVSAGFVGLVLGDPLSIAFRIEKQAVGKVIVSPSSAVIEVGDQLQFSAQVFDLHGDRLPATTPVTWTSSDPEVARIDETGKAQGVSPGKTIIIGTSGGVDNAGSSILVELARRIAFVTTRDAGNTDIYTMNGLGGNQTRLTTSPRIDWQEVWSPNGAKLAFQRLGGSGEAYREEIWVMNADGSNQTNVSNTNSSRIRDGNPAWSPDGTRIAFNRFFFDANQGDIFVMNADGSGKQDLTPDSHDDFYPVWSPDGVRIAHLKTLGGWLLYVTKADGSLSMPIANSASAFAPAWSPDASWIAFTRFPGPGLLPDIYLIHPSGNGLTDLTANSPDYESAAVWSPDGTKLYYHVNLKMGFNASLWRMQADGSNQQQLDTLGIDGPVGWSLSSDGAKVQYTQGSANDFSTAEIYSMSANGAGKKNLSASPGRDYLGQWRP